MLLQRTGPVWQQRLISGGLLGSRAHRQDDFRAVPWLKDGLVEKPGKERDPVWTGATVGNA